MSKRTRTGPIVIDVSDDADDGNVADSADSDSDSGSSTTVTSPIAPYQLGEFEKQPLKNITAAVEDYYLREAIPDNVKRDILPQLMTLSEDGPLYRKTSTIPGAGLGLFCKQAIKRGTLVTYYDGTRMRTDLFYRLVRKFGTEAKAYAHSLTDDQVIVSNFTTKSGGATFQSTQVEPLGESALDTLVKIERDQLGAHYRGHGAMQFANTTSSAKAPTLNTRVLFIRDTRAFKAKELLNAKHEEVTPRPNDALMRAHPDAVIVVLYATKDIPADTELLYFYGSEYIRAQLIVVTCFSAHCTEQARFQCSACQRAFYCSPACQQTAWRHEDHEADCGM